MRASKIIFVLFFVIFLFFNGSLAYSQTEIYDGDWSGTTNQGTLVEFTVEGGYVTYFRIRIYENGRFGEQCGYVTRDTTRSSYMIINGKCDIWMYQIIFSSTCESYGTWSLPYSECGGSGTFTASRDEGGCCTPRKEICDGVDNDCDGDESVKKNFFRDLDGDGYGDNDDRVVECSAPEGYVDLNNDCDDDNTEINPGVAEICDEVDNNCDKAVDEGFPQRTYYRDYDGDGYGDSEKTQLNCLLADGYADNPDDCNDFVASINPAGVELCDDGIDQDCDEIDGVCTEYPQVTEIIPDSHNQSNSGPVEVAINGDRFKDSPSAYLRQSSPQTLGLVTGMDGDAQDIVISGNYAYVAAGNAGLMIFDISRTINESPMSFRSHLPTDSPAAGVAVSGDVVYVAMGTGGLSIVDVSDRSNPVELDTIETMGTVGKMLIDGDYLYIAARDKGMLIYDISTPQIPVWVGRYLGTETYGIKIEGDIAYIADGDAGIQAVNISNRANPYWVGGYNTPGKAYNLYLTTDYCYIANGASGIQILARNGPTSFLPSFTMDTAGTAYDIQGVDDYIHVADGESGLLLIDISKPSEPLQIDSYDTDGIVKAFAIKGNYYYLACGANGILVLERDYEVLGTPTIVGSFSSSRARKVHVVDKYVYLADFYYLGVIDISDATNPSLIGSLDINGTQDVHVIGDYAYVAVGGFGLKIVDISTASNPTLVSSLETLGSAYGIFVRGSYAYLADGGNGLKIINVSDPAHPTLTSSINISSRAVFVVGNYAYVPSGGLKVINVSDPANPTLIGSTNSSRMISYDVHVDGNYAYLAEIPSTTAGGHGLKVFNVSDPANPTLTGSLSTFNVRGIYKMGNYVFLAEDRDAYSTYGDKFRGYLKVIDVSDPTSLVFHSLTSTGMFYNYTSRDLQAVGNYAYLADATSGLKVIDLNVHPEFKLQDHFEFSVDMLGGAISGEYLYTAQGDMGLRVYDICQLEDSEARLVGALSTDDARDMAVSGNTLYLADGTSGLRVVDITNPLIPIELGEVKTTEARSVIVDGDYAYVADGSGGLKVIDISNPATPHVSGFRGSDDAYNLVKCGDTIYLADGASGLRIIDVSTPSSPSLDLGTYKPQGNDWNEGMVTGVSVDCSQENVYLLANNIGLFLLDVSDPTTPSLLGSHKIFQTAYDIIHFNQTAVVSNGPTGLRVMNVSDPNDIDFGNIKVNGETKDIFFSENIVGVAMGSSGLELIDFTVPIPDILSIGSLEINGSTNEIQVVGDYAYLADGSAGLKVIDISDPNHPTLTGSLPTFGSTRALNVYVSGDYAYLSVSKAQYITASFNVIDISNPANPTKVGYLFPSPESPGDVHVEGNYAYLIDGVKGLMVIDVSNPAKPILLGSEATDIKGKIDVVGDKVYQVGNYWLNVFDVSNPSRPVLEDSIRIQDSDYTLLPVHDVRVIGDYAYMACWDKGFKVIDISEPSQPVVVGSIDTSATVNSIYLKGNSAYLSGESLDIIDISDPSHPTMLYNTNTFPVSRVHVAEDYAYGVSSYYGLIVIQVRGRIYELTSEVLVDSTQITAQVPAIPEAGFYDLVVVNPDGAKGELLYSYEVMDDIAPVLGVDLEEGMYCGGTRIVVTTNEEADIYYTLDGGEPTLDSNSVHKTLKTSVYDDITLKCFAVDIHGNKSEMITRYYTRDSTPPVSYAFPSSIRICQADNIILEADKKGTIYYTTDGSTPSRSSANAPAPVTIHITEPKTINFFTVDECGNQETSVAFHSESYMIAPGPPSSYADPVGGGDYCGEVEVKLGFTSYAAIHYTTNGSEPDENSPTYDYQNPLRLTEPTNLKFRALNSCGEWEAGTNTETYAVDPAPVTTADPPGGNYCSSQKITLNVSEAAIVYYTTDGTEPTTGSAVYSSAIDVDGSTTICFMAVDSCETIEKYHCQSYHIGSMPEICDGLDNNCNGSIDEGFDLGRACDGTDNDDCPDGVTVCNDANNGVVCQDSVNNPEHQETCDDRIDNDCDGQTDEGCVCIPSDEICDGIDNDCDSDIDEDLPNNEHNGDVNGDSSVTPQDALLAFQHYLGIIELSQCQQDHADVNNDESITPADALCIFQKYLGLSSCLD